MIQERESEAARAGAAGGVSCACAFGGLCRRRGQLRGGTEQCVLLRCGGKRAFRPAAPQETVFSGASSSCLPSEPPEDAPETLGPGHFTSVQDRAEGEQDPYLELYADGTFMFMCNVYQGMTTYLGTWSYESGVLTLTRPSAEETYVFFAQDADTLLMHSGDLVMTQPGAVLTRLAQ